MAQSRRLLSDARDIVAAVPVSGLGRRSSALGGPLEGCWVASRGLAALPRTRGALPPPRAAAVSTGLRAHERPRRAVSRHLGFKLGARLTQRVLGTVTAEVRGRVRVRVRARVRVRVLGCIVLLQDQTPAWLRVNGFGFGLGLGLG